MALLLRTILSLALVLAAVGAPLGACGMPRDAVADGAAFHACCCGDACTDCGCAVEGEAPAPVVPLAAVAKVSWLAVPTAPVRCVAVALPPAAPRPIVASFVPDHGTTRALLGIWRT